MNCSLPDATHFMPPNRRNPNHTTSFLPPYLIRSRPSHRLGLANPRGYSHRGENISGTVASRRVVGCAWG